MGKSLAALNRGRHEVTWKAEDVSSGVYSYRMQAGAFVQTRKMVLLKQRAFLFSKMPDAPRFLDLLERLKLEGVKPAYLRN